MTKLCYVNINTEESSRAFLSIVEKVFQKVARPDTQIDIKSVKPGLDRVYDLQYSYFTFLNKRAIVERIIEAEKEGYDAAMVSCFLDPGVEEAKSIVNIPIIGLGESTMHYACLLGHRFGIVTANDPKLVTEMELELRIYGLRDRAIAKPVRNISLPDKEVFTKGMQNPKIVADAVSEQGMRCIEDGADVVIVGCNGLGPLCTMSGVVELGENHVPLLDCVSVAIKTAEAVVDLRKRLGLPAISRAGLYRLPREKDIKRVRAIFGMATD